MPLLNFCKLRVDESFLGFIKFLQHQTQSQKDILFLNCSTPDPSKTKKAPKKQMGFFVLARSSVPCQN